MTNDLHTQVLIVGGGPVGLGLAADLGLRGIKCIVVEQGDGSIAHPRANAENAELISFLDVLASEYVLLGTNGLKGRTKLLEYRYDAI